MLRKLSKKQLSFVYRGQPTEDIPRNVTHVTVREIRVHEIRAQSFQRCKYLQCVTIPSKVEIIGKNAFFECTALVEVRLYKGLKRIGSDAFAFCSSLRDVDLPHGLMVVDVGAFLRCSSLQKISIPATVEIINSYAFYGCRALVHVSLHQDLRLIGDCAFADCSSLSAIALPSSLEDIGSRAFLDCTSLLGVEFPFGSKARIQNGSFAGCTSLVNVHIPHSIDTVADTAFARCHLLLNDDDIQLLRRRFVNRPAHKVCYSSSLTTVENLMRIFESSSDLGDDHWKDSLGMTPFHVVATGAHLNPSVLGCLLESYPIEILEETDNHGRTMVDYLLVHTSSKAADLLKIILQKAIVDRIYEWGLDGQRRVGLARSLKTIPNEDGTDDRSRHFDELLQYVGYCTRVEITTILELSAWKLKQKSMQTSDDPNDRRTARIQSGTQVLIENVAEYLWAGESKQSTALSIFPLVSFADSRGDSL